MNTYQTARDFVSMTDEQITALSDNELASSLKSAVILDQKARVQKDMSVLLLADKTENMVNRLETEIQRRGKQVVVPFFGETYLK